MKKLGLDKNSVARDKKFDLKTKRGVKNKL